MQGSRPHPCCRNCLRLRPASSPPSSFPRASLSGSRHLRCPLHRRCRRCPPPPRKDQRTAQRCPSQLRCQDCAPIRPAWSRPNSFRRVLPFELCGFLRPLRKCCPCCPPLRLWGRSALRRCSCHRRCPKFPLLPPASSPPSLCRLASLSGSCSCLCPPHRGCRYRRLPSLGEN